MPQRDRETSLQKISHHLLGGLRRMAGKSKHLAHQQLASGVWDPDHLQLREELVLA